MDRETAQETVNQLAELVGQDGVFWQGKRMEDVAVTALLVLLAEQPDDVDAVFDAWVNSFVANGLKKPRRTKKRLDKIRARLNEGHPVDDLVDAASGWQYSPWHRGENPDGKLWNDVEIVFRDAAKVEMFRDLTRAARQVYAAIPRCLVCGDPLHSTEECESAES